MTNLKSRNVAKLCLLLFLGLFLWTGCEQEVRPSDLVKYVRDPGNGLRKIERIGDLEFDLQYKPLSFVIANEFRSNAIDKRAYRKREGELAGLEYYNLKIKVKGSTENITTYQVSNQDDQQNRLYYLSYELNQDLKMVQGKDTLSPVLFHFERTYDVSNHRTFVLAFPHSQSREDRTLILNSKEIGTGPIEISIEENAINNTPKIKFL